MAGQHIQPIDFACQIARQRRQFPVAQLGHMPRGTGGIGPGHALDTVQLEELAALAQQHRVAHRRGDLAQPRTGNAQQVDMHPHKGFIDDMQARLRQQVVVVGHPAKGCVFHRQHRQRGLALMDGGDHILEGAAGQRLHLRAGIDAGLVRIGARLSLKGDALGHVFLVCRAELRGWSFRRAKYRLKSPRGSG